MASSDRGPRSLAQTIADAAQNALYTGAWVAAGELSTGRRRLVRVGVVACHVAVARVVSEEEPVDPPRVHRPTPPPPEPGDPAADDGRPSGAAVTRQLALVAAVGALLTVGRHQLRHRWLARLARAGHVHPHVALAHRLGAVVFALGVIDHFVTARARASNGTPGLSPSHRPRRV